MLRRDLLKGIGLTGIVGLARPVFAHSRPPIVSRISLLDGRVVMSITIAGKGPYLFMIDTGGTGGLIDAELAQELQLQSTGPVARRGVGGKAILASYIARDVVFGGGARQPTVSLAAIAGGFGPRVRGTLAAGILTSVDSDLDIEAGEWRIYPDGRPERAGFLKLDRAIRNDSRLGKNAASPRLYGEVQVNGNALDCLLDTGAPGAISIGYDVARRLKLWDDARPFAPRATRGVGGSGGIGRMVRVDSAVFGGQRFERPLVLLRGPDDGARGHDGIVGLSMLRGFNLSTEVRTRALWLQRHVDAAPLPDRYGLSGLWLEEKGNEVRVAAVGTSSPAFAAGIQVGDRISGLDFGSALATIAGKPGKTVNLSVTSRSGTKAVRFQLTPFL
ncbi:hypothetical protein WSK_3984 [Novosphingobium sp. Rr 2-17]|uniref:aspartyl protease family protein n=1 Tax=Novosphingobium sp. Rr 2-17 TaxID=555793 RepID=UPI0002699597|nr:aspartyl protease family protein [Novosphingobium sp. Rr 2-17]EIZ77452.1 hypothetical protein WSK_3984 [Novosphingobium sp. Rr 2-17]